VQVYPVLLPHNPTLDAHIRIQQQIAFCHGHLGNLEKEIDAWTRIDTLWSEQENRLEEAQDILAVLEQQAKGLKDAELETQLGRISKQRENINASHTALTPRLELVAHMARARKQILTIRQRLSPQPVPTPPPAVVNAP
jgi:vacuolar-type H+-ATPase subunit H